jgi:hypothetical protein
MSLQGEKGNLAKSITRGDVRDVTSDPSIFHNALARLHNYISALMLLASELYENVG